MATIRKPGIFAALLLTATLARHAAAQANINTTPPRGIQQNSAGTSTSAIDAHDHANISPDITNRMAAARNDERQKRLVADTDKLLALATSLKTDVDKTDKNILSLDVIRRSEEIEKLAKSIRDRAKN